MTCSLTLATAEDAAEVAELRCAAEGGTTAGKDVVRSMRQGKVFVVRRRGQMIATLCLTPKKPWAIDASCFTPVTTPLYLTAMAVVPSLQRRGIGRRCLLEVEKAAALWPAQAIRLDAYEGPAGAGGFYHRCGYREVGRAVYRQTPLIYYERLVNEAVVKAVGSRGV